MSRRLSNERQSRDNLVDGYIDICLSTVQLLLSQLSLRRAEKLNIRPK
jgi:hypothetical protein